MPGGGDRRGTVKGPQADSAARRDGGDPPPVHPIEEESYRILRRRVDLSGLDPLTREVVARMIHASADVEYAATVVSDEAHLAAGVEALAAGAPVICDVEMVRCGISSGRGVCYLPAAGAPLAEGSTRAAEGMREAARRHPEGAVFAVGCAPTALSELLRLAGAGQVRPALVVGLPVGFVGAADAKQALRRSGLPAVSNVGEKGGSAVAAAAVNALLRASRRGAR